MNYTSLATEWLKNADKGYAILESITEQDPRIDRYMDDSVGFHFFPDMVCIYCKLQLENEEDIKNIHFTIPPKIWEKSGEDIEGCLEYLLSTNQFERS